VVVGAVVVVVVVGVVVVVVGVVVVVVGIVVVVVVGAVVVVVVEVVVGQGVGAVAVGQLQVDKVPCDAVVGDKVDFIGHPQVHL